MGEEQYYLLHQSLPTKLSPLCDCLEQIEKIQASKKRDSDVARPGDKGGAKQKTRFASDNTKCKTGDGNEAYRITKKARGEKFCQRCKEYGAPKMDQSSIPTPRIEKALDYVEATTRKMDAKTLRNSKQRWLTSTLR